MSNKVQFNTCLEFNYSDTEFRNTISNLCPLVHIDRIKVILNFFVRDIQATGFDLDNCTVKVFIHNMYPYTPTENQKLFSNELLVYPKVKGSEINIYVDEGSNPHSVFVDLYFPNYEIYTTKYRKR